VDWVAAVFSGGILARLIGGEQGHPLLPLQVAPGPAVSRLQLSAPFAFFSLLVSLPSASCVHVGLF
jgi:hypothetical protein